MWRVAQFSKVSEEQFMKDWINAFGDTDSDAKRVYDDIKLPARGTMYSAAYDFFAPCHIVVAPGEIIKIPTGIRIELPPTYFLGIVPRSGLGTKFGFTPRNLFAVIDADYYYSDNEGQIMMVMINNGDKTVEVECGKGFCQGIILPYHITVDDHATDIRNGGFGSTTK